MNIEKVKKMEVEYFMPVYKRFDVNFISGSGATVKDKDGKTYIDFTAGIGVNSLGLNNAGFNRAVTAQLNKLTHISNLYYNETQINFGEKLCKKTGFDKVLLCNSGAEANECAIKAARKYSYDKYKDKNRTEIITLKNSFHGRTITTLSATGQDNMHDYFYPFTQGFVFCEANNIAELKTLITEKTCAVMIECIQGEGGVIPLEREFTDGIKELTKDKDILIIADEVQTGIGRTGKILCSSYYDLNPDIVTLAKGLGGGLPIGACLVTDKLKDTLSAGTHGTTFGGNPVICAGASYVLDQMTDEFLTDVCDIGKYIKEKFEAFEAVKKVNGKGLMLGIILDTEKIKLGSREIAEQCLEQGLIILTAKENLRLLPPLIISYEEVNKGLEILKQVLDKNTD